MESVTVADITKDIALEMKAVEIEIDETGNEQEGQQGQKKKIRERQIGGQDPDLLGKGHRHRKGI